MLIGEYNHSLDPKKRLAVPSKFRKELGDGAVVTRGLDNCLFVFPRERWHELAEQLSKLPLAQQNARSLARLFLSSATEVEFDGLGRILIPEHLKRYANLQREVVIAGVHSRLEIWDRKTWAAYQARLEKDSDSIAEKLGELGVL
jgi:MraZ protein